MAAKPGLIEYCSIDGEMFTFGYMPNTSKYPNMGVWRRTWLEAIGEEVPKTLEDAERVWYAFTKNDPDGNGVNDTYGLSAGGMQQVYNARADPAIGAAAGEEAQIILCHSSLPPGFRWDRPQPPDSRLLRSER